MKQAYFTLRMMVATAFMAFVVSGNAMSAPLGGVVATGQATITTEPNRVQINQTTDKAVINWQNFDIKPNEHTDFKQPSTDSITLNRVHSNTASNIDGKLTANGNVVIVNQNGVMFGKNAKIDVNGLIATTSDIDNDKFMNNQKLDFNKAGKADATIRNEGQITAKQAGLVGLVAPNVENSGVITAKLGKVTLASGETMTVDMYGDGLMDIAVSDKVTSQLIKNKGIISANGGTIQLTAAAGKKIVNSLIENTGVLSANSVGVKNGVITISAEGSNAVTDNIQADKGKKQGTSTVLNSGTITATGYNSGEKGGTITITADNIGLLNGTKIDASGHTGTITASTDKTAPKATSAGGSIKIGGDYLGKGKTPTAKNLFVAKSTTIKNNATHTGDAGRTILWSDNRTEFHGDISAKALGQDNKGQGGFVETSGKNTLNATGTVQAGLWLLDPNNITIQTSGSNTNVNASPNFTTTNDSAIVTTGSIETALNAGTSVLIKTTSLGTNAQSGDITVSNAISKTAGGDATLTLEADNNIILNAAISSTTGQLAVTLNATGNISGNSSGTIASNGGLVTANVGSGSGTLAGVISGTGGLTKSGTGTLILSGANTYTGTTTVSAGTLQIGAGSTTGTLGSGSVTNNSALVFNRSDVMTVSNVISGTGSVTQSAAGTTTLAGENTYMGGTNINAGILALASSGAIGSSGTISFGGGTLQYSASNTTDYSSRFSSAGSQLRNIDTNGKNITYASVLAGTSSTLTKSGTGTLTLSGANTYTGATRINGGTLSFANQNALYNNTPARWIATNITIASGSTLGLAVGGAGQFTTSDVQTVSGLGTATGGFQSGSFLGIDTTSGNFTYANVIANTNGGSNVLGLTKLGINTLTLSGANTYTGGTNINAGTLALGSSGAIGSSGTIRFGWGTLQHTASNTTDYSSRFSSAGSQLRNIDTNGQNITYASVLGGASSTLTKSGTGTLTLSGANTYTGATTVSAGTLKAGNASAFGVNSATTVTGTLDIASFNVSVGSLAGAGTVTKSSAGTHTLTAGGNNTSSVFSGVIQNGTGTTGLTKVGTGTFTLSGANTYTGATRVNAGTLSFANQNALYNNTSARWNATNITIASGSTLGLAVGGAGQFTTSDVQTISGLGTATGGFQSGSFLGIDTTSGNFTYANVIANTNGGSNVLGLTKFGTNTLTLSGANTYTGGTNINAGTLALGSSGAIGSSGTISFGGGTLQHSASNTTDYSSRFSNAGSQFRNIDTNGQNVTYASVLGGTSSTLTKSGSGTLTLSGANTYTGSTTVSVGTLKAGNASAFGANSAVTVIGTLDLAGYNMSIGSLAGTGMVTNSVATNNTLAVGNDNTSSVFSGIIENGSGTTVLTKSGSGTLILSGANTYTGATTVTAGTLKAGSTSAFWSNSAMTVTGTLDIAGFNVSVGSLAGAGTVTNSVATSNTLTAGGNNMSTIFSGIIQNGTGTTGLIKVGTGTLTLNGVNIYTGATTVSAGTLKAGNTSAFGANSAVTVTGILDLAGFNVSVGSLAGTGTVTNSVATSNMLTAGGDNTSTTFSGIIQNGTGTTALTKLGAGTLTLSGENTYTGGTNISAGQTNLSAGTLALGSSGAIGLSGTISFGLGTLQHSASNTTDYSSRFSSAGNQLRNIDTNGQNVTYASVLAGTSSTLTKSGIGTLTLSGANTYTGATTVSVGTLKVGSTTAFQANSAVTVTGTLDIAGFDVSIGSLAGAGTVTNSVATSNTLTTGGNNTSTTFSGVIQNGTGTIVLTKVGTGTLTLSGANTYTGGTNINAGILSLGSSGAIGSSGTISFGGGTLQHSASNTTDYSSRFSSAGNQIWNINTNGRNVTYASVLAGASSTLTKLGTGILTLSGANTYTGGTNINAGTLALGSSGALSSSGTISFGGGTLQYSASNTTDYSSRFSSADSQLRNINTNGQNVTYASVLAGTSSTLTKSGTGTLTLSGENTYTGATTVSAGTLALASSGAIGSSGTISFGGGTLQHSASNTTDYSSRFNSAASQLRNIDTNGQNVTYASVLAGTSSTLTKSGTGTLTLSGANTYTGATTVSAGTLKAGNASAFGSNSATTITGALALDIAGFNVSIGSLAGAGMVTNSVATSNTLTTGGNNTSTTHSGVIQNGIGTTILTKVGTGTLTLSGANTYTGGTNINAGILSLGSSGAIGSSGTISFGGGTLQHSASNTTDYSSRFSSAGNQIWNINTNGRNVTYASVLAGASSTLTKLGTGILTLSGANTYTGGTNINAGTLALASSGAIGSSGTISFGGGTLQHSVSNTTDYSSRFNSAASQLRNIDTNGQNVTYASVLAGTSSTLTKSGTGTLTLSGANTYTGATTVSAGTLKAGNASAFGSNSATTITGALALDIAGFNVSIGSLAGAGTVTNSVATSNTLTTGGNNTSTTHSGVIQNGTGTTVLTKVGTGTLTLSGANTYTGGTNINAGILSLGSSGAIGSSGTISFGGGTLQHSASNTTDYSSRFSSAGNQSWNIDTNGRNVTYASVLSGASSTLTKLGTGILTLSGANTYTGGTNINAGTLALGSSGAIGSSGTISFGGGTLQHSASNTTDYSSRFSSAGNQIWNIDTNGQNVTYASVLAGTSSTLTKSGAGTLTLSGANTYTGATTVSAGTLKAGNASAFGSNSATTVSSGTILDLAGFNVSVGSLAGAGTVTNSVATSNTLTAGNDNTSSVFSGIIENGFGTIILTKSGTGTLTLSGANTYTGGTNINAGTLSLGSSGAIGSSGTISFGGGTLQHSASNTTDYSGRFSSAGNQSWNIDTNGQNVTYASVLAGASSTLTKLGTGTLTLSGENTYTGGTTINAGTLALGSSGAIGSSGTISFGGGTLQHSASNTTDYSSRFSSAGSQIWNIDTNGQNITYASVLAGTSSTLTKLGTGTLTLSGANTYTGATTVSLGTLKAGNASAFGSNSATTVTGTLDLAGFNVSVGSLAGAGTVTNSVATSNTLTAGNDNTSSVFSGIIENGTGTIILTKLGTGTLTLSGANTYTGGTNINAGTLALGSSGALSSSGTISFGGGTLQHSASNTTDYSSRFSSAGNQSWNIDTNGQNVTHASVLAGTSSTLTKLGSGTLTLSGENTYTGGTNINVGTLALGSSGAIGSSGTISFGGGTLQYSASNTTDYSSRFSSAGNQSWNIDTNGQNVTYASVLAGTSSTLTKSGSGTLTLSGENTYTGGTNINAGILALGSSGAIGSSGTITFGGGTLQYSASNTTDYSSRFSSAGSQIWNIDTNGQNVTYASVLAGTSSTLTKLGTGTLTLSGANTYTGATTVSAGTLAFTTSQASTHGITVSSGATLALSNNALISNPTSGRTIISGTVSGNGTVYGYNASGGNLAGVTLSGIINLTAIGGTLSINGTGVNTLTRGIEIASGTTITNNGNVTLNANGSGGAGTRRALILSGNATINAETGTTTVNVIDTTDVAFRPSNYILTLGGVQNWNVSTNYGASIWEGGNSLVWYFNLTALPNATLNLVATGGITSNMSGWNWSLGSGSTVAINSVNLNGTLNLSGTGTLTSSLPLVGNSGINVFIGGDNPIISGVVSGAFSLTKSGTGTLTLSGANTYTGETTVSSGTLAFTTSQASTQGIIVASGATLALSNNALVSNPTSGRTTISGTVSGNGTVYGYNASGGALAGVTLSGTVNLTASGGALSINGTAVNNAYSRGIEIASGTTITNNGTVTLNANGSGTLGNRRALILAGNATINAVTGTTTVNVIEANGDVAFAPSGYTLTLGGVQNWNIQSGWGDAWGGSLGNFNLTALANATLNFVDTGTATISNMSGWNWSLGSGSTTSINRVNLNGTLNLSGTGTLTSSLPLVGNSGINVFIGGDNPIISGVVSGAFSLTKSGTGTLTLSGANTYTEATTVSAGTLTLGASNVLSDSTDVLVTAGTFNFNNFVDTVASFTTNSGSVTAFGTGSLTTSGAQSFGGQVTGSTVSLTGSSITANNATNDFTSTLTLSSTGAISIMDSNSLTIGTVSAGGNINFDAATDITLNGTLTGTGNITLVTGGDLTNNAGSGALSAGGRWLVYNGDTNNATQTTGGLTGFNRYGCSYNAGSPSCGVGTDIPVSGNGFYYVYAPTVTITGLNANKVYDATTTATLTGGSVSGAVNGDSLTFGGSYTASFDNKNVGTGKNITVTGYTLTGTNMGYTLSQPTGLTANITPKALSITGLTGVNRVYDATTLATLLGTAALSGLEGSDSVSLNGSYSATFDDKNVGNNKTITVTGYSISDSNYSLSPLTGLTANITPKALSITGLTANNKIYDATTTASLSGTGSLVGVLGGDSVTLGGTYVADFNNANVGTGKAITVSGYTINNSNYSFTQPTGLTANIERKPISDTVLLVSQMPTQKIGLYDTFFLYKEALQSPNKRKNNMNYGYFLEKKNKNANKGLIWP